MCAYGLEVARWSRGTAGRWRGGFGEGGGEASGAGGTGGGTELGDEVALKEVCTGGKGDGVGDRTLEGAHGCGKEIEGFGDGGYGGVKGKERHEGFDGCYGHCEVGVGGEEGVVG